MRSVSHRKSRTGHALPNSSPARHRTLKSTYKHFVLTPFLPRRMQAPPNWCPLMHYTVSLLCDRTCPMAFTPPVRHTTSFCDQYSTGAPSCTTPFLSCVTAPAAPVRAPALWFPLYLFVFVPRSFTTIVPRTRTP